MEGGRRREKKKPTRPVELGPSAEHGPPSSSTTAAAVVLLQIVVMAAGSFVIVLMGAPGGGGAGEHGMLVSYQTQWALAESRWVLVAVAVAVKKKT